MRASNCYRVHVPGGESLVEGLRFPTRKEAECALAVLRVLGLVPGDGEECAVLSVPGAANTTVTSWLRGVGVDVGFVAETPDDALSQCVFPSIDEAIAAVCLAAVVFEFTAEEIARCHVAIVARSPNARFADFVKEW